MYICAIFDHIIENVKKYHIEHDKSPIKDRFSATNHHKTPINSDKLKKVPLHRDKSRDSMSPQNKAEHEPTAVKTDLDNPEIVEKRKSVTGILAGSP